MMKNKTYTITLADGTVLDNLTLNGNNYVSAVEITKDIFNGNLSTVTISDGEHTHTHKNMKLVQLVHYDDGYYFILRKLSPSELQDIKNRSDIDYIAMMSDIEL